MRISLNLSLFLSAISVSVCVMTKISGLSRCELQTTLIFLTIDLRQIILLEQYQQTRKHRRFADRQAVCWYVRMFFCWYHAIRSFLTLFTDTDDIQLRWPSTSPLWVSAPVMVQLSPTAGTPLVRRGLEVWVKDSILVPRLPSSCLMSLHVSLTRTCRAGIAIWCATAQMYGLASTRMRI
jgi:hypothetical protein